MYCWRTCSNYTYKMDHSFSNWVSTIVFDGVVETDFYYWINRSIVRASSLEHMFETLQNYCQSSPWIRWLIISALTIRPYIFCHKQPSSASSLNHWMKIVSAYFTNNYNMYYLFDLYSQYLLCNFISMQNAAYNSNRCLNFITS